MYFCEKDEPPLHDDLQEIKHLLRKHIKPFSEVIGSRQMLGNCFIISTKANKFCCLQFLLLKLLPRKVVNAKERTSCP